MFFKVKYNSYYLNEKHNILFFFNGILKSIIFDLQRHFCLYFIIANCRIGFVLLKLKLIFLGNAIIIVYAFTNLDKNSSELMMFRYNCITLVIEMILTIKVKAQLSYYCQVYEVKNPSYYLSPQAILHFECDSPAPINQLFPVIFGSRDVIL